MGCPACRTALPAGARFCPGCGASVETETATAPPDPLRTALEAVLGFQYRIGPLLGRGGMGAVYLAHELALDRDVAIKALPPELAGAPELRERFRREARTAARLGHPGIVPLHTFGEAGPLVYFVMGYVRGESLASRLRRAGRLPPEEAGRLLSEIAGALDYAHRQGVVHRDIKPDNVLIDEDSGRALLADFGIAKARQDGATLTGAGHVVGTPAYMSPEQAEGRPDVDARSDIYSLGVMGYLMLAGRLPFEGRTPAEVLVQHMTAEPPPLHAMAPQAGDALVAAITRCLRKPPSERWPDADALRQALVPPDPEHEEEDDNVKAVRASELALLVLALAAPYASLYGAIHPGWQPPRFVTSLAAAIAGVALVVIAGGLALMRRAGLPWRAVFYKALAQPRAWRLWYPRRLRRPGDVWDRLPRSIRALRLVWGLALAHSLLVLAPFVLAVFGADERSPAAPRTRLGVLLDALAEERFTLPIVVLPMLALMLAVILATMTAPRWLAPLLGPDADQGETRKALLAPAWKASFWRRQPAASLLSAAASSAAAGRAPLTPDQLERDIGRAVRALPEAQRGLADDVAAAARSLVGILQALDEESRVLAREADLAEAGRLEEKLQALGGAARGEAAERRQLRELLEKQLELARSVNARRDRAVAERSRKLEQLRGLQQAVAGLSAPGSADHVRALCAQIADGAEHTPTETVSRQPST